MLGIDPSVAFVPVQLAVLTISDSRSERTDASGALLVELATAAGHRILAKSIVRDERAEIEAQLRTFIADPAIDAVLATGGTGLTARDVTPEVFHSLYDKQIEGFGELFRWLSHQSIGTSTLLSRATAGVVGGTYMFALPGSPSACRDGWTKILAQQLDIRHRPCNLAELMPRLLDAKRRPPAGPL